ncbi:MAG: glycosyltransferase [Cyclobacteriaceae bacterium]
MIFLISIFSVAHVAFYLILSWKWSRMRPFGDGERSSFSIIIPVRNEEKNIEKILDDLQNQTIDQSKFEVIVVDDFSTDSTRKILKNLEESIDLNLKILSLSDPAVHGKKNALTMGIKEARNEIILTTDADCRLGERWIESYSYSFTPEVQIVAGPVALEGDSLFSDLQRTEFAGLIGFGGVTLESNNPSMCSGANLAFKKKAFEEVGGYQGNIGIPSGDDEFLLYDIMMKYPKSGRFLKSEFGTVRTKTQPTFGSFWNQRSRWISKWKYNKNWKLRLIAVLIFTDYLLFLLAIVGTVFGYFTIVFLGIIFIIRLAANYSLLKQVSNFLHHSNVLGPLLLLQLFYPVHVLVMGIGSLFSKYTWKGRSYG